MDVILASGAGVGRAILPAAAFQAASSAVVCPKKPAESRLQPRLAAPRFLQKAPPGKTNWHWANRLPHRARGDADAAVLERRAHPQYQSLVESLADDLQPDRQPAVAQPARNRE